MMNLVSQHKGNEVTIEQIKELFNTHLSINDRIMYLLGVHNKLNATFYVESSISRITFEDNMISVFVESNYLGNDYLCGIYLKYDVELFTDNAALERYIEQLEKDNTERIEKQETRKAERKSRKLERVNKILAKKAERKSMKLERAKKILAKNGFTVVEPDVVEKVQEKV